MKCIEVVCFMNGQVIGQIKYDERQLKRIKMNF